MQTTLLGIGIALILALLAALLGPLFIDWNAYRAQFEAEASRLIGAPVRVAGPLDVRLLPSPSLTVENLEIGPPGEQALRARALSLEFALGPLLSGKLRADQMRVVGPQTTLVFGRDGRIGGQGIGFAPEMSIERLNVEDGRIAVADSSGEKRLLLDKFWYTGDVRSLAGSFRGEGAFVSNEDLVGYRVAASRQDNAIKLRLTLEPSASPMPVEIEGAILAEDRPRFEGSLVVSRPAGTTLSDGRAVINEPFRLTARVNARHPAVLFDQLEFQYGPEERALKLTGTAEWTFGGAPRLDAVLTARALDIDRLVATAEQPRRPPFAAVAAFAENFGSVLRPSMPVKIGLSVDTLTLGGAPMQSVRGDVTSNGDGWNFDGFEFRAPGLTQVRVSGRAQPAMGIVTFTGPVDVSSADPRSLLAWLEGKEGAPGTARPMRGRGDVSFGADKFAIERLRAEIDRRTIEGRLAYRFAHDRDPARLDAALKADEIDLDALLDVWKAAFGGVSLERPKEMALSLDVGQARLAGVDIRGTRAALSFDASALTIERLAVADLGGASFTANGRIDLASPVPQGGVAVEIDARDLAGVGALIGRFAPDAVSAMQPAIARAGSARLRAAFDVAGADRGRNTARLSVEGTAGAVRVNFKADARGEASDPSRAEISLAGGLEAADANALFRLLALDRTVAGSHQPGRLTFSANGPLQTGLRVESRLEAANLDARAAGNLRFLSAQGLDGRLDVTIGKADLAPLRFHAGRGAEPLPVRLASRVVLFGRSANFEDLTGTVAGTTLRGQVKVGFQSPLQVEGRLEATALDSASLLASAIGMPAPRDGQIWAAEPFSGTLLTDVAGAIELRAARLQVTPALATRDLKALVRLSPSNIAIEDLTTEMGGGKLTAQMNLRSAAGGVTLRSRFDLKDANAAQLLPGNKIAGRINLQLDLEGTGLSPKALIGSLSGTGRVSMDAARFASLDPKVFPSVMRAADQELPPDLTRLSLYVQGVLDAGQLDLPHAEGSIAVAGGQARLASVTARAIGADLALSGSYDFAANTVDGQIVLIGSNVINPAGPPEIGIALKGNPSAASRSIDVSALMSWLTLRSVEQQAKKIEAIEAQRAAEPPVPLPVPAPLPAPAPDTTQSVPQNSLSPLPPPIVIPGPRSQRITPPRPATLPTLDRNIQ
ncbi:MAG: AsmA family protein [Pseudorhodoplanes sp.]|nr:AsmA family protein [Pseudorhodoplanes sp.]